MSSQIAFWHNPKLAKAPGGAILEVWETWRRKGTVRLVGGMPKGGTKVLRARPLTNSAGLELPPGTWKDTTAQELSGKGFAPLEPAPPQFGDRIEDKDGRIWKVGRLLTGGERVLLNQPTGKIPALAAISAPMSALVATYKVVETYAASMEREGRERAERIEAELKAKAEAKRHHRTAAQMKGKTTATDGKLFA